MKQISIIAVIFILGCWFSFGQNSEEGTNLEFTFLAFNDTDYAIDLIKPHTKNIVSSIVLWFEEAPEVNYQNTDIMEFFGIDLNINYSKGPFDFLIALENILKLNWNAFEIEPTQEFISPAHDWISFSHVTDGLISAKVVYNF